MLLFFLCCLLNWLCCQTTLEETEQTIEQLSKTNFTSSNFPIEKAIEDLEHRSKARAIVNNELRKTIEGINLV